MSSSSSSPPRVSTIAPTTMISAPTTVAIRIHGGARRSPGCSTRGAWRWATGKRPVGCQRPSVGGRAVCGRMAVGSPAAGSRGAAGSSAVGAPAAESSARSAVGPPAAGSRGTGGGSAPAGRGTVGAASGGSSAARRLADRRDHVVVGADRDVVVVVGRGVLLGVVIARRRGTPAQLGQQLVVARHGDVVVVGVEIGRAAASSLIVRHRGVGRRSSRGPAAAAAGRGASSAVRRRPGAAAARRRPRRCSATPRRRARRRARSAA